MTDEKSFLDIVNSLDGSIKKHIDKMNLPYPLSFNIGKDEKMDEGLNKILSDIKNKIPKTFESSIPYVLSELTDNIEQHSKYQEAFVFIKYSSEEKCLEIIVFDDGLTIPSVFDEYNINYSKDSEAIKMALEGKTTKKEDISRGYGLRTTRNIVKALNGEIQLISRNAMLVITDSKIHSIDFVNAKLNGTLIYLKLKTPDKDLNIYQYLE